MTYKDDWTDGDILYAADLNANLEIINKIHSMFLKNSIQFEEDDYTADTADTSTNFVYNTTLDEYSTIDDTSAIVFETATFVVYPNKSEQMLLIDEGFLCFQAEVFTTYDECNDSSIDTDLWTITGAGTGADANTENTQAMTVKRSGQAVAIMSTTIITDTDFFGTDTHLVFYNTFYARGYTGAGQYNGTTTRKITITDGTHDVDLVDTSAGAGGMSVTARYDIIFDSAGTQVYFYIDGVEHASSPFDLSSLTDDIWKLELYLAATPTDAGAASEATITIYYVREVASAPSELTKSISSNDGANYDVITKNIATISTPGYELKGKISGTYAGETVVIKRVAIGGYNASVMLN